MNANVEPPRSRAKPPRTLDQLRADVKHLEQQIADAERENGAAAQRLKVCITEGDEDGVQQARADRDRAAAMIAPLLERLAAAREDEETARQRAHKLAQREHYQSIERAWTTLRTALVAHQAQIDRVAKTDLEVRNALDDLESLMRAAGVPPDPYLVRARWEGVADIRMACATYLPTLRRSVWGKLRTLDSIHQVRLQGLDDLVRMVAEAAALELRKARATLRVSGTEE